MKSLCIQIKELKKANKCHIEIISEEDNDGVVDMEVVEVTLPEDEKRRGEDETGKALEETLRGRLLEADVEDDMTGQNIHFSIQLNLDVLTNIFSGGYCIYG